VNISNKPCHCTVCNQWSLSACWKSNFLDLIYHLPLFFYLHIFLFFFGL